ncbi:MAG: hypothetical protein A2887_03475 [Alphaproteobacteria bacterium RIFCSPLOWO2_01_FULL_40_26]|nr:MAG: hypothetical protein A3D15_00675 [Alphaproteobacteria bacterium RIFCSPHIGHO2_02_FULL_40_34]OFW87975.1 MAG: hypothetical protein A2794_02990 [Alphaproteobacteria bacterium RIFCSPHIGHO2_01_FULL_40_8]OFW95434.1 MAG: hypothetical protein A2887_03475 [Alphaproteobacteria bacterium RIFCSPLOWO2_01_FULL_40_26]OFX09282.1 MAG: hypothetical protein A3H30_05355 [Alphaproteobacteria bacterium RIFCSPLOWO2_02_FULL_40_19]OFX10896.1 MAG: hypothetical protein A3G22_00970 [Alphaproteobacteria bacterium RI
MKKIANLFAVFCLYFSSSCALMFNGSKDTVTVRSNEDNVKIYINESYIGKNSAITTINKKDNYMITVSKNGCSDKTVPVTRSFDPITLLGFLIDFGLISILLIDGAATRAWHKADQTAFVIDPECGK